MKYLILFASLLAISVTKLVAQEKSPIVIQEVSQLNELHIKELKVHTTADLRLSIHLSSNPFEKIDVYVLNSQKNIIRQQENIKGTADTLTFEMEKNDLYTVRIIGIKPIDLTLSLVQN